MLMTMSPDFARFPCEQLYQKFPNGLVDALEPACREQCDHAVLKYKWLWAYLLTLRSKVIQQD
jgi:hypothetical protein